MRVRVVVIEKRSNKKYKNGVCVSLSELLSSWVIIVQCIVLYYIIIIVIIIRERRQSDRSSVSSCVCDESLKRTPQVGSGAHWCNTVSPELRNRSWSLRWAFIMRSGVATCQKWRRSPRMQRKRDERKKTGSFTSLPSSCLCPRLSPHSWIRPPSSDWPPATWRWGLCFPTVRFTANTALYRWSGLYSFIPPFHGGPELSIHTGDKFIISNFFF